MPEFDRRKKPRAHYDSDRREHSRERQNNLKRDSSHSPRILTERKSITHEKRSISHEKRHHSKSERSGSREKRSTTKYSPGSQRGRTTDPIEQRAYSPNRRQPNASLGRERSDSEQSEHRRKILMCVAVSVGIGILVGSLIGYGVYLWITSVQKDYYEANPNRNSDITDAFNAPTTTISLIEKQDDQVKDFYNSDPDPKLDAAVGINAHTCGKLHDSVENPFLNNANGRKKRQANSLERVGRIVGGSLAQIEHHPWQVSLWTGSHTCGGSMIASNWILFAAHCAIPYPKAANWTVYGGETDRRYMKERGQVSKVTDLIVHEFFDEDTFDNDLALLRLEKHFMLTERVQTVCLPTSQRAIEPNIICYISGWGAHSEDDARLPYRLQYTPVTIMRNDVCNADDWLMGMVTKNMFCAGTEDGSRDACQGDSGGPLTCYDAQEDRSYLMGTVSWGIGCGEPLMPGVYTNLPLYLGWIREAMSRVERRYFSTG